MEQKFLQKVDAICKAVFDDYVQAYYVEEEKVDDFSNYILIVFKKHRPRQIYIRENPTIETILDEIRYIL